MRWMELSAFTPVYRTHEGNRPEESVQFYEDEETLSHFARFAKVYRALSFCRSALMEEASRNGIPVVRHPMLHYPDIPAPMREPGVFYRRGSSIAETFVENLTAEGIL